jgi:hypothetical protein
MGLIQKKQPKFLEPADVQSFAIERKFAIKTPLQKDLGAVGDVAP